LAVRWAALGGGPPSGFEAARECDAACAGAPALLVAARAGWRCVVWRWRIGAAGACVARATDARDSRTGATDGGATDGGATDGDATEGDATGGEATCGGATAGVDVCTGAATVGVGVCTGAAAATLGGGLTAAPPC